MGLLMWRDYVGTDKSYYPTFDLNGNVTGLLDDSGQYVAWYEYDAFGKVVAEGGAMKDTNPIRFSTQYTDEETGLVYYGFRYYDPSEGRFLNRDPIGEAGGLNLYQFAGNDPVNSVDRWGLNHAINLEAEPEAKPEDEILYIPSFTAGPSPYYTSGYHDYMMGGMSALSLTYNSDSSEPSGDGGSGGGGGDGGSTDPDQKDQWDEKRCADLKMSIDRQYWEVEQLLKNNGGESFLGSNVWEYTKRVSNTSWGSVDFASMGADSLTLSTAALGGKYATFGVVGGGVSNIANTGLAGANFEQGNVGMGVAHSVGAITDLASVASNTVPPMKVVTEPVDFGKAGIAWLSIETLFLFRDYQSLQNEFAHNNYFMHMQGSEMRRRSQVEYDQALYDEHCN